MTARLPLLDALDARAHDTVRPGRLDTAAGELRWDTNAVTLDGRPLAMPAVQLSRSGERGRGLLARLVGRLMQRETLFAELRTGTQRVRLRATAPAARLEGLVELALDDAAPITLDTTLDLLHAVRVHGGRLVIAAPGAGRVDLPVEQVPEADDDDDDAPQVPAIEASPAQDVHWRVASRGLHLWLLGLPAVLAAIICTTALGGSAAWIVSASLAVGYAALTPALVWLCVSTLQMRDGPPDPRRAGSLTSLVIGGAWMITIAVSDVWQWYVRWFVRGQILGDDLYVPTMGGAIAVSCVIGYRWLRRWQVNLPAPVWAMLVFVATSPFDLPLVVLPIVLGLPRFFYGLGPLLVAMSRARESSR